MPITMKKLLEQVYKLTPGHDEDEDAPAGDE
jgi:hypothetical protein